MRTLTAPALAAIANKRGEEPILIIEIDWTDLITKTYCTVADYLTGSPDYYDDRIMSVSDIQLSTRINGAAVTGSFSLSLDDTDGSIKTLLDANNIYLRPIRVYQAFRSLAEIDRFIIFDGAINTPVTWREGDRIVDLVAETRHEDGQFGYAPEEGEFTCISPSAVGQAWPLCYGTPVRYPAVKITDTPSAVINTAYRLITYTELRNLHPLIDAYDLAVEQQADYEAEFPTPTAEPEKSDYAAVIQVTGDAQVALDSAISKLLDDEPNKESNLILYPDDYRQLRDELRTRAIAIQDKINDTELLAQSNAAEAELVAQLADENALPLPNATQVAALTADIAAEVAEQVVLTASIASLTAAIAASDALISTYTDDLRIRTVALIEANFTTLQIDEIQCFDLTASPTIYNVVINNTVIAGSIAPSRFLRTSGFNRLYNNITFDTRLNSNPNEFWITSDERIKGMYILINKPSAPYYAVAYVTEQVGKRCFFEPPLYKVDGSGIKTPYLPGPLNGHIDEVCGTVLPDWLVNVMTEDADITGFDRLPDNDWSIEPGDFMRQNTTFGTKYVANCIPSTTMIEVLAFRTVDGRRKLHNVPLDYFIYDLNETLHGQNVTTISLRQPLSFFPDEQWEETIYVTLESSIGPNAALILSDLITRYANTVTPNGASITALQALVANHPMNFCIHETGDVLDLVNRVAWQGRIGVIADAGEVFFKYLSSEEADVFNFTTANVMLRSQVISLMPVEDLRTKMIGNWQEAGVHVFDDEDELHKHVTIRNNIPIYGKHEEEYNFFAYNTEKLVTKSMVFWAIRYSMVWTYLEFTAFLDTFELQVFDTVDIVLPEYSGPGVIQEVNYDPNNNNIKYKIWLPLRSGESVQYPLAWPSSTSYGTLFPTVTDPFVIIGDTNGN